MILVLLVLLLLLGGANYYISHRLCKGLPFLLPKVSFRWIFAFLMLMTVITLLGITGIPAKLPGDSGYILRVIGAYWMGVFVYLLLFTLATDVLYLLLRLLRIPFTGSTLFRFSVSVFVVLCTAVTVCYGAWNAEKLHYVSYDVQLTGKTDISDMKIVMISDLHLGSVGSEERLAQIVDGINSQQPDLVCIAGDFFDTDFDSIRDPKKAIATLQELRATYGIYACLGNHDAGQTVGKMRAFLEESNIHLLQDEAVVIDERLLLVGRLDASPIGGYGDAKRKDLAQILPENTALPVIVLDHNPAHVDTYEAGADLVLSGHTHQGQIFPGNLITDALYTVDHGYYQKDAHSPQIIVSSGVGYWGLPVRVGTNSEINIIHLSN